MSLLAVICLHWTTYTLDVRM